MTKKQTRQYAMLVRVRDFGNAHKDQFPEGSEAEKALAVVTAAVVEVEAFTNAKLTAKRVSNPSKRAAKQALAVRIAAIVRSARVVAKAMPGADEKFPMPVRKGDFAVLQTGRLFLQEAAAVKDTFIRCGLPPTFMEDLQQAVTGFEQAISGRSAGRTGATVSQKGIRASLKQGVDAVGSLDALVLNVLGHDGTTMNAWKRDRRVDMVSRSAAVGASAHRPASLPAATEPLDSAAGEPPVALSDPPLLEKAS